MSAMDEQDAVEEMGFADVGDAAVNDDAGVENLRHPPRAPLAAKQAAEGLQVEHVPLVGADDQADVGHDQKEGHIQERARAFRNRGAGQHQTHQVGAEDAEDRANCRAEQPAHAGALQPHLKQENR